MSLFKWLVLRVIRGVWDLLDVVESCEGNITNHPPCWSAASSIRPTVHTVCERCRAVCVCACVCLCVQAHVCVCVWSCSYGPVMSEFMFRRSRADSHGSLYNSEHDSQAYYVIITVTLGHFSIEHIQRTQQNDLFFNDPSCDI